MGEGGWGRGGGECNLVDEVVVGKRAFLVVFEGGDGFCLVMGIDETLAVRAGESMG
jgi:hypothetical protein